LCEDETKRRMINNPCCVAAMQCVSVSILIQRFSESASMAQSTSGVFAKQSWLPFVAVTALLLYVLIQYMIAPDFLANGQPRGNDDALRLLSVRDLLGGQGWFDKVQYRILPPEGLELHWSRLLDAVLAAIFVVFSALSGPELAERLMVALWPALLFLAYLGLVARAALEARGPSVAAFAMLAASVLPALNVNFFALGKIDHHNLQLVLMMGLVAALFARGLPRPEGYSAGAFSAISLAVGFEMLPFIGLSLLVMVLHVTRDQTGSREKLLGFGLALGAVTSLLYVVEIAPGSWGQVTCDRMGLPMFGAVMGTMVFSVIFAHISRDRMSTLSRAFFAFLIALLLVSALSPVLAECVQGPYAGMPDVAREGIMTRILENASLSTLVSTSPQRAVEIFLPFALLVPFLATGTRKHPGEGLVLAFIVLGLIGAIFQLRALIWAVVVLPLAFGMVMDRLVNQPWGKFTRLLKPFVALGFAALFLAPPQISKVLTGNAAKGRTVLDRQCLVPAELAALRELPSSVLLTPLNMGVPVVFHTQHAVLSAPYHTHPDAHANGVVPFGGSADELRETATRLSADYVILCRDQIYEAPESAGSLLSIGVTYPGFEDVETGAKSIRVLKLAESVGDGG